MSAADNAAAARSINDAYNARDYAAAAALSAPDAEWINVATGQTLRGPDGARQFLEAWATAFPDSQVETTTVIAADDGVAMEFVGRGTHSGPLASPTGDIPPTGKHVEVPFAQMIQFRDGKIARARLYFDLAGMLQQLGLAPMGAASPME
jgi:steroid delta-isomerase-like uncharacterized protein